MINLKNRTFAQHFILGFKCKIDEFQNYDSITHTFLRNGMSQRRIEEDRQKILKEINRGELQTLKKLKRDTPDLHWIQLTCEKTGDSLLHVACKVGCLEVVKYLVEEFNPVVIEPRNYIGKTPLHDSTHQSHFEITKYLLANKAEIDAIKRADWTPLMLACTKSSSDAKKTIEILLENGANVNYQNKDGWTTLHLVCREGNPEILDLLINYNLDLNKISKNGRSGLHTACLHSNYDIVKKLIKKSQLDINLKDGCGNTPLHDAVLGGNIDIISTLIENNADVNATNGTGLGILHLAVSKSTEPVIEYLIDKLKVDLNLQNVLGLTPAHFAAKEQRISAYKTLERHGADMNIKDFFGRKPQDYFE